MEDDKKPWLETRFNKWEVNSRGDGLTVNCCANEVIEIDKLFGPLSALGVRIFLEYTDDKSDWVVEREILMNDEKGNSIASKWVEMARWDCQLDWPEHNG